MLCLKYCTAKLMPSYYDKDDICHTFHLKLINIKEGVILMLNP